MLTNKFNEVLSFQNLKNVGIVHIFFLLMNSFYSCFRKAISCISLLAYDFFFFLAYLTVLKDFLNSSLYAHFWEVKSPP